MEKTKMQVFLFSLVLALIISHAHGGPDENDAWTIRVNMHLLYSLVKENARVYYDAHEIDKVLKTLCELNGIAFESIDHTPTLNRLTSTVKYMFVTLKKETKRGGKSKKALINKWMDNDYVLNVGTLKRKLCHEVESERKKRKLLNEEISSLKKETRRLKNFVSRLIRRKYLGISKQRKTSTNYSLSWKRKQKSKLHGQMKGYWQDIKDMGLTPVCLSVEDKFGNKIEMSSDSHIISPSYPSDDPLIIDHFLYRKDRHFISDMAYQELSLMCNSMPSLKKLRIRADELNKNFSIMELECNQGVEERFKVKLLRLISQYQSKENQTGKQILSPKIKVKISGDGTFIGKRYHVVNMTFSLLLADGTLSGNHILSIMHIHENYSQLKTTLANLSTDISELSSVCVNNKTYQLEYVLVTDLKFLNVLLGLQACSAKYFCAWCLCPSDLRWDTSKDWSQEARTIQFIQQHANKRSFGCIHEPILSAIQIANCIPDVLHLFLRISDQLVSQLIEELFRRDNIARNSKQFCREKATNICKFETFVQSLKIKWNFYVDKNSKLIKCRDFTGPEHILLQNSINLDELLPGHPKLNDIKILWQNFKEIITMVKRSKLDLLKQKCKDWVNLYAKIYQAKDVTPYMHVLLYHVPEALRVHGDINVFSQQGMEKMNDFITAWYFRSSNHKGLSALRQILQKQNRIEYLGITMDRAAKYSVTCSACSKEGHNKRTCQDKHQ